MNVKSAWTPIDLNRGVTMRHDKDTGTQVYMYKDDPGYYYSQFGKPLPDSMAEAVGFPVPLHKKERIRKERRTFATQEIDKELEIADKRKPQIITRRGEFMVIDRGVGRADVVDEDGNTYNPQPVPLAMAEKLLTAMAGQAEYQNPQEVLVARKKHDAIERVREGYDKEIDVEGVREVVGGKREPSVMREGAVVNPMIQDLEANKQKVPGYPTPYAAEAAEKARLTADDPNAPNAIHAPKVDAKFIADAKAKVETSDNPDFYQGGSFPSKAETNAIAELNRPSRDLKDPGEPKGPHAPDRSKPDAPQGKVRSLG